MTPHRFAVALLAASLLSGCASQNPYDQSAQGDTNKTAVYGGLGALAGAAAGALINHDNRGKGALIGAAVGAAAGGGYGYYADKQEEELRRQMQGTGVQVRDPRHRPDRVEQRVRQGADVETPRRRSGVACRCVHVSSSGAPATVRPGRLPTGGGVPGTGKLTQR